MQPNQSIDIKITVRNSATLKPGGTYAALVVRQTGDASNAVNLQPAIGAGIFITKEEGAIRALGATEFAIKRFMFGEPTSVAVTFKNTGNVQVVPRGQVLVTNQSLAIFYKKGIINQESFTLLPNKIIRLNIPLQKIQSSFLPSRQKVILQYRYDGSEQVQTIVKQIVYIPIFAVITLILVLLLIVIIAKKFRNRKKKITYETTQKLAEVHKKRIIVQDKTDGEKIAVHRGK